ncbi:MAG: hypothetical protein HOH92_06190 [Crocinitomicaceae bacterium]|nr:hypothetical protein [Crocinitomicaceae bacterium]
MHTKNNRRSAQRWKWAIAGLIVLLLSALIFSELNRRIDGQWKRAGEWWGLQATEKNYGDEVQKWSAHYDVPFPYLMALIQLESGGRKPAGRRFEEHVFERLKEVQVGTRTRYENVVEADLDGANDEAIRNLATSWGPFQLMGYKCILLDLQIRDIRGQDAIRAGVEWIDVTYGDVLRKGSYEDAFHLHNTGKPFPKSGETLTYHPDYVEKGIRLMEGYTPRK